MGLIKAWVSALCQPQEYAWMVSFEVERCSAYSTAHRRCRPSEYAVSERRECGHQPPLGPRMSESALSSNDCNWHRPRTTVPGRFSPFRNVRFSVVLRHATGFGAKTSRVPKGEPARQREPSCVHDHRRLSAPASRASALPSRPRRRAGAAHEGSHARPSAAAEGPTPGPRRAGTSPERRAQVDDRHRGASSRRVRRVIWFLLRGAPEGLTGESSRRGMTSAKDSRNRSTHPTTRHFPMNCNALRGATPRRARRVRHLRRGLS